MQRPEAKNYWLSCLSFAFATSTLWAAEAPPVSSDTNLAPVQLPPVTVTARRFLDDPLLLPVSVTAVTDDTLQQADVLSVKQASVYAPNVFLNEFTARKLSNPYFRGIGSSPNNPGVTTYIDGVPQLNANSSSLEFLDMEQAEFIRGPQSALFGRNSVGGILNLTSRTPSAEWRGDLQTEYGNYNLRDVRMSLSGPISHEAAFSLAGGYSARDGYTQNDHTGHNLDSREALFGKAQFQWMPDDQWRVRLLWTGEQDRDGDYALGDLAAIRADPHHVNHNFEGHTRRDLAAPTLQVQRTGAATDFSAVTGLVWWKTRDLTDLDYSPIPAVVRDNTENNFQFTEDLRLGSNPDHSLDLSQILSLKWQAGVSVFYQDYRQDAQNQYGPGILYQPDQFGPGVPASASPANTQHSPEASLEDVGVGPWGQLILTAWDHLDLAAAVHGDYENKNADLKTYFANPDPYLGSGTSTSPSRDFSQVSPQFNLSYRLSRRQSLYGTIAKGYKAGGFNPTSPAGLEAYGEEKSWNYEVGWKSSWLEDRLQANLAAFYTDWQDLQLNLPTGVPGQFYIANAGNAYTKGVELELKARPVAGWDLFASAGYLDARFTSGAQASRTDPLGTTTAFDAGGNHLIYAPDFTVNAGSQYNWHVCEAAMLYVRGEVTAYGRYFYNPANTASQSPYSLADFRAGCQGRHWFVEGWVRNAFDTQYVPVAFEFPNGAFGGSGMVGENGAPLTFGLRGGLMF